MSVTVDQSTLGQNGVDSAGFVVLTTTQPVAAGATILLWFSWEAPTGQAFDGLGGGSLTWDSHVISASLLGDYNFGYSIAYAPSGLAASTAITFSVDAVAPNVLLFGSSFNGILDTSPIDDDGHNENSAPPANAVWDCGALTTTTPGLVAACGMEAQDASRSSVPLTNYIETHQFARGTDDTWTAVYRITTASGSYTPGGTWDNASDNGWGSVGVALKEGLPPGPEKQSFYVARRRGYR